MNDLSNQEYLWNLSLMIKMKNKGEGNEDKIKFEKVLNESDEIIRSMREMNEKYYMTRCMVEGLITKCDEVVNVVKKTEEINSELKMMIDMYDTQKKKYIMLKKINQDHGKEMSKRDEIMSQTMARIMDDGKEQKDDNGEILNVDLEVKKGNFVLALKIDEYKKRSESEEMIKKMKEVLNGSIDLLMWISTILIAGVGFLIYSIACKQKIGWIETIFVGVFGIISLGEFFNWMYGASKDEINEDKEMPGCLRRFLHGFLGLAIAYKALKVCKNIERNGNRGKIQPIAICWFIVNGVGRFVYFVMVRAKVRRWIQLTLFVGLCCWFQFIGIESHYEVKRKWWGMRSN
ncbi:hypothetical protein OCOL_001577 [Ordospora colligata]